MRTTPAIFLALMLTSEAQAQQDHPIFPSPPATDQLDNGLTVVTVPLATLGVVAYYTLVEVGSRDEVEEGHTGFAHLFEHMMFRGTETRPGEEYQRALQAFGADTNAYTSDDYTVYTITAPAAVLPQLVAIEADRFQNLSYDEEGFRSETSAVLGEYNSGSSSPWLSMTEQLLRMAVTRHPYGHTTMGYLRDVCAMPGRLDYSRQFFQRYYTPDNTTLIVAGDVDRQALLELVRTHYGGWSGERYANDVPREPAPTAGARAHLAWPGTTPPNLMVGYRVPDFDGEAADPTERAAASRRVAALEVVRALAFHESSPLYQRLVVDEQRLLWLVSWPNDFSVDPGLFTVRAVLSEAEGADDFDPIIAAIQAELDRIGAGEVSAERVAAVQSHIRYSFVANLETPGIVATTLARFITVGGAASALDEYLDALDALTPEDVAEAAATYLVPERRFVVSLAPAAEGEQAVERPTCQDLGINRTPGGE